MPQADDAANQIERMLAIKALPVFVDVHPDELAVIAAQARLCTFGRGDTLYAAATSPVGTIHLVLAGRVTEHRGGRPFVTHGPQHVLGGVDALASRTADVVAIADEPTRTLAIERSALRDVLEDNFGVLSATLQGVAAATLRLRRRLVPTAGHPTAIAPTPWPVALDDLGARIAFLRERTWLRPAHVRALGHLAGEAEPVGFTAGEGLWALGDPAEHAMIVVDGSIACTADDTGLRFTARQGTLLGLEEALAIEPRWYDATVHEAGSALCITRAAIVDVLEDDADSALDVLAAFAGIASGLRDEVARAGSAA